MKTILQEPHALLRAVATPVEPGMIKSAEIVECIEHMKRALSSEDDGIAIAAPQIGISLRIFVVAKRASKRFDRDMVFINPEYIRIGKKKEELSEGCLSCRWKYGLVRRATTASIRALNEEGNEFVMKGEGLLAQIFQHEIDHLDGVLFIDKARNIEDIPPETNHGTRSVA